MSHTIDLYGTNVPYNRPPWDKCPILLRSIGHGFRFLSGGEKSCLLRVRSILGFSKDFLDLCRTIDGYMLYLAICCVLDYLSRFGLLLVRRLGEFCDIFSTCCDVSVSVLL